MDEFNSGFKKFLMKHSIRRSFPDIDPTPPFHITFKAGPNGPAAILSSSLDAKCIFDDKVVLEKFKELCELVKSDYLYEKLIQFNEDINQIGSSLKQGTDGFYKLAKLTHLSDKAGKTRTVYILNY
jgi:hypothetical protein